MKNKQIKNFVILSVVLSCLTVFWVGIMTLGQAINADSTSFVLGAFTLLVTLLVAWNIWSTIDAKGIKDEFRSETNYIHNKIDFDKSLSDVSEAGIIAGILSSQSKEVLVYQMLIKCAIGAKSLANLGEYDMCDNAFGTVFTIFEKIRNEIKLSNTELMNIIQMLSEIKDGDDIPNCAALKKLLEDIIANQEKQ